MASVYLAAWKSKALLENWVIAATALLFSSLPMFYHFEMIAGMPNLMRFGLVDNFQAGVAAMAAAAFVRKFNKWFLALAVRGGGNGCFYAINQAVRSWGYGVAWHILGNDCHAGMV